MEALPGQKTISGNTAVSQEKCCRKYMLAMGTDSLKLDSWRKLNITLFSTSLLLNAWWNPVSYITANCRFSQLFCLLKPIFQSSLKNFIHIMVPSLSCFVLCLAYFFFVVLCGICFFCPKLFFTCSLRILFCTFVWSPVGSPTPTDLSLVLYSLFPV